MIVHKHSASLNCVYFLAVTWQRPNWPPVNSLPNPILVQKNSLERFIRGKLLNRSVGLIKSSEDPMLFYKAVEQFALRPGLLQ